MISGILTAVIGSAIKGWVAKKITGNAQVYVEGEVKGLVQSKTIGGAAVLAIPFIARLFGWEFSAESIQLIFDSVFTIIGAAGVIWGRVTAVKKIG